MPFAGAPRGVQEVITPSIHAAAASVMRGMRSRGGKPVHKTVETRQVGLRHFREVFSPQRSGWRVVTATVNCFAILKGLPKDG